MKSLKRDASRVVLTRDQRLGQAGNEAQEQDRNQSKADNLIQNGFSLETISVHRGSKEALVLK